mmetsp:Transcript_55102/g.179078  ORF Transcript_55102/g.179078 Transcript_55102/m.179078 type:complete len:224 (+) Transcript_55102:292-963(+)
MMLDELSTTQRTMQTVSIELPNFSKNYIAWQGGAQTRNLCQALSDIASMTCRCQPGCARGRVTGSGTLSINCFLVATRTMWPPTSTATCQWHGYSMGCVLPVRNWRRRCCGGRRCGAAILRHAEEKGPEPGVAHPPQAGTEGAPICLQALHSRGHDGDRCGVGSEASDAVPCSAQFCGPEGRSEVHEGDALVLLSSEVARHVAEVVAPHEAVTVKLVEQLLLM